MSAKSAIRNAVLPALMLAALSASLPAYAEDHKADAIAHDGQNGSPKAASSDKKATSPVVQITGTWKSLPDSLGITEGEWALNAGSNLYAAFHGFHSAHGEGVIVSGNLRIKTPVKPTASRTSPADEDNTPLFVSDISFPINLSVGNERVNIQTNKVTVTEPVISSVTINLPAGQSSAETLPLSSGFLLGINLHGTEGKPAVGLALVNEDVNYTQYSNPDGFEYIQFPQQSVMRCLQEIPLTAQPKSKGELFSGSTQCGKTIIEISNLAISPLR